MRGINKVILVGNVGAHVETRYMADGKAVSSFSLATNRPHRLADGAREDVAEWHRVAAFGKLGEIAGQLLSKGTQVYVEGRMVPQRWTDKDGNVRSGTEVWAEQMQLLGRKPTDYVASPPSAGIEEEIPF